MRRELVTISLVAVAVAVVSCGGGGGGSGGSSSGRPPFAANPVCSAMAQPYQEPAIGGGSSGFVIPESSRERVADIGVRAHTNHLLRLGTASPDLAQGGYSPAQLNVAYNGGLISNGSGAIAVVDAYSYPTALNDFNTFSNNYHLPTEPSSNATASSNAVFEVVYANGSAPAIDGGWAQESAIDIEWTHAMAPGAKIYLVEAASSSFSDVTAAVKFAASLPGVRQVSTSFGGTETACFYVDYDSAFTQPGVVFFAAAGDSGGVRNFPAMSNNVVSVGGTTLSLGSSGRWLSETIWSGTGCGPSAYEPRPVFQDPLYSKIGKTRGGCDLAAVADPNTGVAVYDSYPYQGFQGWFVAGGTSVACPIVAGIVNASGKAFSSSQAFNQDLYGLKGSNYFHQISIGSAGGYSAGIPWCFPVGLGSPNNLAAGL